MPRHRIYEMMDRDIIDGYHGNGHIHFEQLSSEDAKASSFRYLVSNTAIHHAIRYSSDAAGSSLKGSIEIEYDKYDSALSCYKSGTISAA